MARLDEEAHRVLQDAGELGRNYPATAWYDARMQVAGIARAILCSGPSVHLCAHPIPVHSVHLMQAGQARLWSGPLTPACMVVPRPPGAKAPTAADSGLAARFSLKVGASLRPYSVVPS